jgi:alkylhydroperoxidase family enzyme
MTTKLVINCTTGEQSEVELTAEELAQREVDALAYAAQEATEKAESDAKAAAKTSAQTKLKALGLSDAEILSLTN